MAKKRLKKEYQKKLLDILLILLIIIFVFCLFKILIDAFKDYKNNKMYDEITEEVVKEKKDEIDFKKLKDINPEIVAWIKIPNNTIIFGHNNHRDSSMFGDLEKIYNGKMGEKISIYIYTPKKKYTYQVYATYIADPNDETVLDIDTKWFDKTERKFNINKKNSKTLTLSTCNKDGSKRIIIHALKI